MSCVICARISTVRLTRKWANWASFSGLAAILQMPIRGLLDLFKEKFDTPNGLAQFFSLRLGSANRQTHRRVPDGTVNGA